MRRNPVSVCTTCHQADIRDHSQHECKPVGELQMTRHLGRGVVVDTAPQRALLSLYVLRNASWPVTGGEEHPDLINIADQVLYQVIGYVPESACLLVELVEDWRTNSDGGAISDGVCTAIIKSPYTGNVSRCTQPATHYDENKQPDPTVDGEPGGWHQSEPDREGERMVWSDRAGGATPHKEQP
jgi:hypothetical protein